MVRATILMASMVLAGSVVGPNACGEEGVASSRPTTDSDKSAAKVPAKLSERLGSADRKIRNMALVELSRQSAQGHGQLSPTDVGKMFEIILTVDDPIFVGQATHILRRHPGNAEAVALANRTLLGDQARASVVGALIYLERHDGKAFERYFEAKKTYNELPLAVKTQLATAEPVRILWGRYCAQLVSEYLNWQPPKYSADVPNPYIEKVVAAQGDVVPYLIAAQGKATKVSPCIVRALGEIGVPEGLAFLVEAYKNDPRRDIAVAIGSSWRSRGVEEVFNSFDERSLRMLLGVVLTKEWGSLKGKDATELKKYILEHLVEIIKECRLRSRPVLG